jgi:hypothetical protein
VVYRNTAYGQFPFSFSIWRVRAGAAFLIAIEQRAPSSNRSAIQRVAWFSLVKFKLDTSQSADFKGATEAVKANYTMQAGSISVPVQRQVANFSSSQEVGAAMQAFANEHNLVLEPKTKSGKTVGQRLTQDNGRLIMWSHGSLQCLAPFDGLCDDFELWGSFAFLGELKEFSIFNWEVIEKWVPSCSLFSLLW